ncbi:hypothetical protein GCM10027026_31770 [Myroides odoratimimus subsp. xuanwuensis]
MVGRVTTSSTVRTAVPRRRGTGGKRLLGAALMVLLGAWLPWIYTGMGSVTGVRGAGLWTMYAAVFGIAGAMIPRPRWSAVHAAILAAAAVGLGGWQIVHLLSLVGFDGWMPGPGLVLTLGGGVLAATVARTLWLQGSPAGSPTV